MQPTELPINAATGAGVARKVRCARSAPSAAAAATSVSNINEERRRRRHITAAAAAATASALLMASVVFTSLLFPLLCFLRLAKALFVLLLCCALCFAVGEQCSGEGRARRNGRTDETAPAPTLAPTLALCTVVRAALQQRQQHQQQCDTNAKRSRSRCEMSIWHSHRLAHTTAAAAAALAEASKQQQQEAHTINSAIDLPTKGAVDVASLTPSLALSLSHCRLSARSVCRVCLSLIRQLPPS